MPGIMFYNVFLCGKGIVTAGDEAMNYFVGTMYIHFARLFCRVHQVGLLL